MRPCSWSRHPHHIGRQVRRVSYWCCGVSVEQGQPSHAGRQALGHGWEPGGFMGSSGMTKRLDGIIAHYRPRYRTIHLQCPMGTPMMVILKVLGQEPPEMSLV